MPALSRYLSTGLKHVSVHTDNGILFSAINTNKYEAIKQWKDMEKS